MRVKIFLVLFLVLLVSSVLAERGPINIQNAICEKDGSMDIIFVSRLTNKFYTENISIKAKYIGDLVVKKPELDVIGKWEYDFIYNNERTIFISDDIIFKLRGEYLITTNYSYNNKFYTTNYIIECPGFEFSCKLLGVHIDYCRNINNERFEVSARIFGLGDVTKENLSLDNNVEFMLQSKNSYEDYKGKISERGSLPKGVVINNPYYGQYYFNVSFGDKIESFVAKIGGINYIEGGCLNYPNISLYSYKECEDIKIEEKEEQDELNQSIITGQIVKETEEEILEKLEKSVNTEEKNGKIWPLFILFIVFSLSIIGVLYMVLKRKFNK